MLLKIKNESHHKETGRNFMVAPTNNSPKGGKYCCLILRMKSNCKQLCKPFRSLPTIEISSFRKAPGQKNQNIGDHIKENQCRCLTAPRLIIKFCGLPLMKCFVLSSVRPQALFEWRPVLLSSNFSRYSNDVATFCQHRAIGAY
jgi:hypothetical protein